MMAGVPIERSQRRNAQACGGRNCGCATTRKTTAIAWAKLVRKWRSSLRKAPKTLTIISATACAWLNWECSERDELRHGFYTGSQLLSGKAGLTYSVSDQWYLLAL